jgi:hypothetical protein
LVLGAGFGGLELTTRLNGTVVQHAPLSDLTYTIPVIVGVAVVWEDQTRLCGLVQSC